MNNLTVQLYQREYWKQIAQMLKAWPFKPMAQHSLESHSKLLDFTRNRVRKVLESKNCHARVVFHQGHASGFASLHPLPWDSEQLGILAARIDYLVAEGSYDEQLQLKETLLEQILWEAYERGFHHLSTRVDASDFSSLHALECAGFVTVDTIITFAMDLSKHQLAQPTHDFAIRLANASDADEVAALAKHAFIYDRFHADPFIDRERADALHAAWLRDSCLGKSADAVLIAESEDNLLGFSTCVVQRDTPGRLGRKVGTLSMVASAKHARGRGVGQATMMAAIQWMRRQGCDVVEGGTQVCNVPSARLFRKCGFSYIGASVSLRRVFDVRQRSVFRSHFPVRAISGSEGAMHLSATN